MIKLFTDVTTLPKEGDTILATVSWRSVHLLYQVSALQAGEWESPFKYVPLSIAGLLPNTRTSLCWTQLVSSHHFYQPLPLANDNTKQTFLGLSVCLN